MGADWCGVAQAPSHRGDGLPLADGRSLEPTARYVAVDGPVSRIEPCTDEHLVEVAKRYLRPEQVEPYLEFARAELGETVVIHLKPQHWLSADLELL